MVLLFIIKINAISLDGKTYDAEMNITIITALIKKKWFTSKNVIPSLDLLLRLCNKYILQVVQLSLLKIAPK